MYAKNGFPFFLSFFTSNIVTSTHYLTSLWRKSTQGNQLNLSVSRALIFWNKVFYSETQYKYLQFSWTSGFENVKDLRKKNVFYISNLQRKFHSSPVLQYGISLKFTLRICSIDEADFWCRQLFRPLYWFLSYQIINSIN